MSDWVRGLDFPGVLGLALACLGWSAGGWLMVRAWFNLRPGERLMVGLAAGFIVYLTLVNLLTPLVNLTIASLLAAGIILAVGLVSIWKRFSWAEISVDLGDWPQLLVLLALTLLFEMAQRGVSIFDEYLHLPMVSIMGAGIIPPRFYLNPDLTFAYHYGLQVFAAVLENKANFYAWSAWDLTRALAIGLTFCLGWVWVRRGAGSSLAGVLGAMAIAFGSGARWLLLLLPASVLSWAAAGVTMTATGADTASNLVDALNRPWLIEGGGTVPFPFAYHNGVFVAQFFTLGSTGALPAVIVLVLLLLARPYPKLRHWGVWITLALILANLALSAEHLFVFLWLSICLIGAGALLTSWRHKTPLPREQILGWFVILLTSALLSVIQGGFITETIRSLLLGLQGKLPSASNLYGFELRWPPAIASAHLGQLSPFNLRQLVALLAEMGPVLLAAPLATLFAWRAIRRGDWLTGGFGLSALLMILFTFFVAYGMDRSSTRFANSSLWIWLVLAFPFLWRSYQSGKGLKRAWLGSLLAITLWGGFVMFSIQLTSIPRPIPASFINSLDLAMSRKYWNQLPVNAQVLDDYPERAVAVFGRIAKVRSSIYIDLPERFALIQDPTPKNAAAFGYSYVYVSNRWEELFTADQRQAFKQPCVKLIDQMKDQKGNFRSLYDIRNCKPEFSFLISSVHRSV